MTKTPRILARGFLLLAAGLLASVAPVRGQQAKELPARIIPNLGEAAEFYFSPDDQWLIGNAKLSRCRSEEAEEVATFRSTSRGTDREARPGSPRAGASPGSLTADGAVGRISGTSREPQKEFV